jgi:phosphohistidine phosphatase
MRTLYLVRHGAAEAGPPGGSDFDRSLTPEGRRASQWVGAQLAQASLPPTFALCSSARRAVQTLEAVRASLALGDIRCERELYLAGSDRLRQRIGEVDDRCAGLLLIGHNPGIGLLAHDLVRPGSGAPAELLKRSFPAAALAVLAFEVDRWTDIGFQRARLVEFTPPTRLDATR